MDQCRRSSGFERCLQTPRKAVNRSQAGGGDKAGAIRHVTVVTHGLFSREIWMGIHEKSGSGYSAAQWRLLVDYDVPDEGLVGYFQLSISASETQ